MQIKNYLNFFRTKNLLMIVLIQILIKYVLFEKFYITLSLNSFHFFILILATVLIALGGYIINDISDIRSDKINKPQKIFVGKLISKKNADLLFIIFNFTGLLLGYYLSYSIDQISFFSIFIIASLLSYLYSIKLKKILFVKNLTVAFLVFLCVFLVALYDIVPATNEFNNQDQLLVFNLVLKIASFAFLLTLIREIVKDIQDKEGDKELNINSLPIVYSVKTTKIIIYIIGAITIFAIVKFAMDLYPKNYIGGLYLIIVVTLPLLYALFKLYRSHSKIEFETVSKLLKFIMLLGIFIVFIL